MPGFSVNIGANAIQFSKTLGDLQAQLKRFQAGLSSATGVDSIARINRALSVTKERIDLLKGFTGAQPLQPLVSGSNSAAFALTNLGRVAQDVPFGFLGIQNNLNPLLESFQRLRAESGSNSAALKALGKSLIGAGGLGLALSLASSAILLFGDRFGSAKKELEGFGKAQSESNKEAGDEIAHLRVLAAVAANTANSTRERKEASEQLTKVLKASNVQLSEEEALNNKAAAAIAVATKAILERARARAIENRIAELSAQNLDREIKRVDLITRQTEAQKKLNKIQEDAQKSGRLAISDKSFGAISANVSALTDKIKELDDESGKATTEINSLLTKVTATPTNQGGTDKVVDLLKQRIEALQKLRSEAGLAREQQIELAQLEIQLIKRDSIKTGFKPAELQDRINAAIEKSFPGEQVTAQLKIRIIGDLDTSQLAAGLNNQQGGIDISAALGLDKIDVSKISPVVKALQDAAAAKNELARIDRLEKMGEFLSSTLQPAFTDLFESIITGGTNAFQEFGRAIGRIITKLIAAAAAAAALAGIITLITGGTAAGAAGFLANFKGLFSGFTGFQFASGGIVSRPTFGLFGEAGPEAVIPLSRLPQIIGQSQGGGTGGNFTARIVDGGRDLILIMQQANKTFGRNF